MVGTPKRKKSELKPALITVVSLVVLGVGFLATLEFRSHSVLPPNYTTLLPRVQDIEQSVLSVGKLHPVNIVNIGAQVSGQIKKIYVQPGASVRKDQLIAEIDSTPQSNALRSALAGLRQTEAQLKSADATLAEARKNANRQASLFEHDVNSSRDLDTAVAALEVALANVSAQRSAIEVSSMAVEAARVNLNHTRIVSPIDGDIIVVLAAEGQTVNANQITPNLAIIGNLDRMEVQVKISEADVNLIRPGMKASFTILGDPSLKYSAMLKSIDLAPESLASEILSPSSNASNGGAIYYNAMLEIENPDRKLRISMTAKVTITVQIKKNALVIPLTALMSHDNQTNGFVNVLVDGFPIRRKIRLGIADGVNIEVIEGLSVDDQVVVGVADSAT